MESGEDGQCADFVNGENVFAVTHQKIPSTISISAKVLVSTIPASETTAVIPGLWKLGPRRRILSFRCHALSVWSLPFESNRQSH